jgi:putative inorganic carbon (HCO3(-)) transporter
VAVVAKDGSHPQALKSEREILTFSGRHYITHYQIRRGTLLLGILLLATFLGLVLLYLPARAGLVATGVLILSAILAIYPYLGLFAQVWLYFRPFPVWSGPEFLRPIFLVTIVTMLFFLLHHVFLKKRGLHLPLEAKLLLALLGCTVLSSFFAVHSSAVSFSQNVIFAKIILFYLLVINLVTGRRELDAFVWVILACCALASLEAIRVYRYYGYSRIDTVGGTHREANYLAATLVLALPLAFYKIGSRRLLERLVAIGLVPTFMVGVVLTGSRSGTLALAAVLGLLAWRFRRRRFSMGVLVVLLLATVVAAPSHYWSRTETIADYQEERAAESRIELWRAGLRMFLDHPLTGVGQGNFIWVSPRYTDNYYQIWTGQGYVAHNIFIQFLAEGGLQSLLAFVAFLWVTFRGLRRVRRKLIAEASADGLGDFSKAVEIGLIGFLVAGFFLSSAHLDIFYWILALGPVTVTLTKRMTADAAMTVSPAGPVESTVRNPSPSVTAR